MRVRRTCLFRCLRPIKNKITRWIIRVPVPAASHYLRVKGSDKWPIVPLGARMYNVIYTYVILFTRLFGWGKSD